MTLLDFIIHLWKVDEQFNFTPVESAFYTMILKLANNSRWKSLTIPLDNRTVMLKLRIGKAVFDTSQARIIEAGLVSFQQGNGRGRATTYTLLPPPKHGRKGAVPDHLFEIKGTVPDTLYDWKGCCSRPPLFFSLSLKGAGKVVWNGTLFIVKPATSEALEPPKIVDTIGDTIVSPFPTGAREPIFPPKEKKKAPRKPVTNESPLYTRCIDRYDLWVRALSDTPAKIDGVQGKAMKAIITYLRTQVTYRAQQLHQELTVETQDQRVYDSWCHVLDHTHLLSEFLQGQTRLQDFNSNLQNILVKVRNELSRKNRDAKSNDQTGGVKSATAGRGGTINGLQGLKRNGSSGGDG